MRRESTQGARIARKLLFECFHLIPGVIAIGDRAVLAMKYDASMEKLRAMRCFMNNAADLTFYDPEYNESIASL